MDVKVSENCLSQPCSDDHLLTLSLDITIWEEVAPFLRLSAAEEEEIACDHPTSKSRKIAMLRKWRGKFGRNATYGSLADVFRRISRSDWAEKVETLAMAGRDGDAAVASEISSASTPYVTFLPSLFRRFLCMVAFVPFVLWLVRYSELNFAMQMHAGHTLKCTISVLISDSETVAKLVKVQCMVME